MRSQLDLPGVMVIAFGGVAGGGGMFAAVFAAGAFQLAITESPG
jgi:hypothetical protein